MQYEKLQNVEDSNNDKKLLQILETKNEADLYKYIFVDNKLTAKDFDEVLPLATRDYEVRPPVVNISLNDSRSLIIIGDIHGSLWHLDKYIKKYFNDGEHQILFLGDLVDRGDYNKEILIYVISLTIMNPTKYHLLRGNHEDLRMNIRYGFEAEVKAFGGDELMKQIISFYNTIPLNYFIHVTQDDADKHQKTYFATHGGVFWDLDFEGKTLYQLLMENNKSINSKIGRELVWNDPNAMHDEEAPSGRGGGLIKYGKTHFRRFQERFGIDGVLRGHEVQPRLRKDFGDDTHLTIFGSYAEGFIVELTPNGTFIQHVMK